MLSASLLSLTHTNTHTRTQATQMWAKERCLCMWSLIADITRASRLSCLTASFAALQANTHSRAWKRAANLRAGTESTCFTSTKVQILPRLLRCKPTHILGPGNAPRTPLKVLALLVQKYKYCREPQSRLELSQVTCFTSTKVQILTPEELRARILPRRPRSHLLLPPLVLLRRTHSPLTTARSSHTVRTRGYSSTRATHVPLAPLRGRCAAPGVALRSVAQSHAASVLGVRAQ